MTRPLQPDYGLDAPGVVLGLALGSAGALGVGFISFLYLKATPSRWMEVLAWYGVFIGICLLAQTALMIWSSRVGKLRERDRIVDAVPWRGAPATRKV